MFTSRAVAGRFEWSGWNDTNCTKRKKVGQVKTLPTGPYPTDL